MLKQNDAYGCGLYAVANALDKPDFINTFRLEASKEGNNINQLNKWLVADGETDFHISPIWLNMVEPVLPKEIALIRPATDDVDLILPFLMTTGQSKEGKLHMIAGWLNKDGWVTVLDSLKNDKVYSLFDELHNHYPFIYSFCVFAMEKGNEYLLLRNKK